MKIKLLLLTFGLGITMLANAQREKIQCAYLYQFTRYIDWCPEYKTGDFVIGIFGDSPLVAELEFMAKTKKVVSQNIVIKKYTSVSDIGDANIVIISSEKSGQLSSVLSKIGGKCMLVVADKSGLAKNGAAISFMEQDGKLLFELNKDFFASHHLNVSSTLVSLAKNVY